MSTASLMARAGAIVIVASGAVSIVDGKADAQLTPLTCWVEHCNAGTCVRHQIVCPETIVVVEEETPKVP